MKPKSKRKRTRLRNFWRMGGCLTLCAGLFLCCFACHTISLSAHGFHSITNYFIKYPGAGKIGGDSYWPGRAPLEIEYYTYWTPDSLATVVKHYEKRFPEFEQVPEPSWWSTVSDEDYPTIFRGHSNLVEAVLMLDAGEPIQGVPITIHYAASFSEDAPNYGTLIVIAYINVYLID